MTFVHKQGRLKHSPGLSVDRTLISNISSSTSAARIEEPLNPLLNYFEIEIIKSGAECAVGIGAGELRYPLSRMPGWNKNSIGYHGDDGRLYHERGSGSEFGPRCEVGHRMGCGLDFSSEDTGYVDVFFTRNGERVGKSVRIKRPLHGLYPLIGLHSNGESVRYLGHWYYDAESVCEAMIDNTSPSNDWLRCNGIKFLHDGLTLEYAGDSSQAQDVGIAQARHKMNRAQHYFEMEIVCSGANGALAIGLAARNYPLHVHPGWNPGAIGYHADDGKVFVGHGVGEMFGPVCGEGDRIGCGVRYNDSDETASANSSEDEGDDDTGDDDTDAACVEHSMQQDRQYLHRDRGRQRGIFQQHHRGLDDVQHLRAAMRHHMEGGMMELFEHHQQQRRRHEPIISNPSSTITASSTKHCVVYFTKNGEDVGEREFDVPKGGLYPVVAMLSKGERLRVNWSPLTG